MTTELTDDDIRSRIDLAHIEAAAEWAAYRLGSHQHASVHLTPGDATRYEFLVVPPGAVWRDGGATLAGSEFLVVLGNDFGRAYPWSGQEVHPSYAAAKWTTDCRRWTGVVVAAFLNALAGHLADQ